MKRMMSALLAMLLLLSLTACGQPEPVPEATETVFQTADDAPIEVSTVEELLAAIKPGAQIQLAEGDYVLSDAESYGKNNPTAHYAWESLGAGEYGLKLQAVDGLTVRGAGMDKTRIVTDPRSANVLTLTLCRNVVLENMTIGHTQRAEACEGGVVKLDSSSQITLKNLGLFGCGSIGAYLYGCEGIEIQKCDIYDCTIDAVSVHSSRDVTISDCAMHDLGKDMPAASVFEIHASSDVTVSRCDIVNNYVEHLINGSTYDKVTFQNNRFLGNNLSQSAFQFWEGNFVLEDNLFEGNQLRIWYTSGSYPAVDMEGQEVIFEDPAQDETAVVSGVAEPVSTGAQQEVRVSTVDAFLDAIASDTCIILEAELLDLSAAKSYAKAEEYFKTHRDGLTKFQDPSNANLYWEDNYDGPSLVISGISNMTILAEGEDRKAHTISALPRYANVLTFENCIAVTVSGFTAGHTVEPGYCAGGVLQIRNCEDVLVDNCGLFGCGTMGVDGMNTRNLQVVNCEIYECSITGISLSYCDGVAISGTLIRDIGDEYGPRNFYRFYNSMNVTLNGGALDGNYHGN